MKQAILYGGAFNPPTLAHLAILQACFDYAATINAEVWIMPSGERTDKTIGVSIDRRLALIDSLIADANTRACTYKIIDTELRSTEQTETYETTKKLQDMYPDHKIFWVFGTDSVATMKTWGNGNWLYSNLHMLLVARPGYELPKIPPRATMIEVDSIDVSSTQVRNLLKQGMPVHHLVPSTTHSLIIDSIA